jgi:hypothetical protein
MKFERKNSIRVRSALKGRYRFGRHEGDDNYAIPEKGYRSNSGMVVGLPLLRNSSSVAVRPKIEPQNRFFDSYRRRLLWSVSGGG